MQKLNPDGQFTDPTGTIFFTTRKTISANQRTIDISGFFSDVRSDNLTITSTASGMMLRGEQLVDILSLTTDAPGRDRNLTTHLFRAGPEKRFLKINIAEDPDVAEPNRDDIPRTFTWQGRVRFESEFKSGIGLMHGLELPVSLKIEGRDCGPWIFWQARTSSPISLPVTALGLPFGSFLQAVGNPLVPDHVLLEWGLSFRQQRTNAAARKPASVCIVGAGVAGMAAAQSLIEKGLIVTVIEKESAPGGKTSSYIDEDTGYTVEHGIHGFFPSYRNLKSLLNKAGISEDVYTDTVTTGMADDGAMYSTQINNVHGPAPFFLLRMLPRGMFRLRDLLSASVFLIRCIIMSVIRDSNSDDSTFRNILRTSGVSRRLRDNLLIPYLKNLSYARGEEVSAWAAMEALNYYVLEDAEDVKARWLRAGPAEVIFTPWMKELALRGVTFRLRTKVQNLIMQDARNAAGVTTGKLIREADLGEKDRVWIETAGTSALALHWHAGTKTLSACEARCTHEGCPLKAGFLRGQPGFRCDCHGGFFSPTGQVLQAPPQKDLPKVPLKKTQLGSDNFWEVDDGSSAGTTDPYVRTNYTILAVDISGARNMLTSTELRIPSLSQVNLLRTTSVMVLRLWFRTTSYCGPDSGVFAAAELLDNFFIVGKFQPEFNLPDFTVVECHIGDSEKVEIFNDNELYALACACLARFFPDFSPAALDHGRSRILRHADVFSLFAPGDLEKTPRVTADDRPNLLLAGDWIRTDHRSWFMERAAVTGMEAACEVLIKEQLGATDILQKRAPPWQYRFLKAPVVIWRSVAGFTRRILELDG